MERITKACLFLLVLSVLVGLHQVLAHGDFYELKDVLTPGLTHELFINGLALVALALHLKSVRGP